MFVPSPELLIENLTEIQNFHKDKLIGQVNLEKAVLIQRF